MLTPTLFDVAAVTGLRPDGDDFDPTKLENDTIDFDDNHVGLMNYIGDHYVDGNPEVTIKENIAFLALWLTRCVLYCKSLKVVKRYLTLVNQLHEGRNVNFSQLILGSLYTAQGEATKALRNINPQDKFLLAGPL